MVNQLAMERGEWSGYPIPDESLKLVVEPTHPLYESMNGAKFEEDRGPDEESLSMVASAFGVSESLFLLNTWITRDGREVWVYHNGDGRSRAAVLDRRDEMRIRYLLNTICASHAWEPFAEVKAVQKLSEMVPKHMYRNYVLSGFIMETSKRSGVTYVFRRGRPTLAIKLTPEGTYGHFLAALCLHPIAYYEDSFAGAMVPTDEVIAHLLLMRGDERRFWAKSNQHSLSHVQAGL